MRIAIPVSNGTLDPHFGHCRQFALVDVEPGEGKIITQTLTDPPPHEPGALPAWLAEQKVELVLAGGMGSMAQNIFATNGIRVIVGAPPLTIEALIQAWHAGELDGGANACDH